MVRRILLSSLACVLTITAQPPKKLYTSVQVQLEGVTVSSASIVFFDGPGATQTYPAAINNSGTITGYYADANGGHGFLRGIGGGFVTFNAPGSENIFPSSINTSGAVAGNYSDTSQHGFLRTPKGGWVSFDVPGTFPSSSENPIIVNDSGTVAGPYFDGTKFHGFLWAGGGTDTIDFPESTETYATGINNMGNVAGTYADASFNQHGFVLRNDGTWFSFDVPGGNFGFFTPTLSINNNDLVVGSYFQGSTLGFLWPQGGSLITFSVPGAAGTQPSGTNSKGVVAGSYQDASFTYHGFVRTPSGGIYTFSIPDAIGTFVVGINDKGMIAGYYTDTSNESHGFLLTL
ncbi:MAG: hypothetical protein ABSH32_27360 [Bryobacteraceae bacterium]|jgi:hypothetical protein